MRPDYQTARQLERQEQECRRRMRGVARKHMFGRSLRRHPVKAWLYRIVSQATGRSLPELEAGL